MVRWSIIYRRRYYNLAIIFSAYLASKVRFKIQLSQHLGFSYLLRRYTTWMLAVYFVSNVVNLILDFKPTIPNVSRTHFEA